MENKEIIEKLTDVVICDHCNEGECVDTGLCSEYTKDCYTKVFRCPKCEHYSYRKVYGKVHPDI